MKMKWFLLPVIALAAVGVAVTSCDLTGGGDSGTISWGAVANGATDTTDTTTITLNFEKDPGTLTADVITITNGTGKATKGALSGTAGLSRSVAVTGVEQGTIKIKITKSGISALEQVVHVYKIPAITWRATANGAAKDGVGTETSTEIEFQFSQAVAGLAAGDITIDTEGTIGEITKGALSANGFNTVFTLKITEVKKPGVLMLKVAKTGFNIAGTPQEVTVYKAGETAVEPDWGNMGKPAYVAGTGDTEGKESQAQWEVDYAVFKTVTRIVVEFKNPIAGGMQLIYQLLGGGDPPDPEDYGGWNSVDVLTDMGAAKDGMTEVSTDKKTITFLIPGALKDGAFPSGYTGETIKIVLGYYTGDTKMNGLVVKADHNGTEPTGEFKAVTDITIPGTGLPATLYKGKDNYTLTGGVTPPDATKDVIVWSLVTEPASGVAKLGENGKDLVLEGAGTITVTATIKDGKAAGEDFVKTFEQKIAVVAITETEPLDFSSATPVAVGEANTALTVDGTSFTYKGLQDYQAAFVCFPLEIADGKTFSDYVGAKFTFEVLGGGDGEYKTLELWASDSSIASAFPKNPSSVHWQTGDPEGSDDYIVVGKSNQYAGDKADKAENLSINITTFEATGEDSGGNDIEVDLSDISTTVYLVIYFPSSGGNDKETEYKISNVTFLYE